MGGTGKQRRILLAKHLEQRPDFLSHWMSAQDTMLNMRENPLSNIGKDKHQTRAVSTLFYCGISTINISALLRELVLKGVVEEKRGRVRQYRRT
tara:strand:+ start:9067 stop:9348 length:282 start_codon:yes stop_codon:yes gene_type:complete